MRTNKSEDDAPAYAELDLALADGFVLIPTLRPDVIERYERTTGDLDVDIARPRRVSLNPAENNASGGTPRNSLMLATYTRIVDRLMERGCTEVRVECVDFITIPTRDVARSVAFYRDILGIPESEHWGSEVETANVTLTFWNPEAQGVAFKPNEAGFALRVPDVQEARSEIESRGVEFLGETYDSGVCHMGFFKDPDGNLVILHRRYAPRVRRAES